MVIVWGLLWCVCCCCRGFGVRVDELEVVGVVWDEVVCVARLLFLNGLILGGLLCGVFWLFC